jgi:hypothetical protein
MKDQYIEISQTIGKGVLNIEVFDNETDEN